MKLNADFTKRVAVHVEETEWVQSPAAGVQRKMLDRIGDEIARATTIVRFAPGSAFEAHTHGGGEEYLVLDGVFQDETGDFPVGSYVRNPPTSRHTPAAEQGATILVKLHQMQPDNRTQVHVQTHATGPKSELLYRDTHEEVRMERWTPESTVGFDASGGAELFVVNGGFSEGGEAFMRWDWLRLPPGSRFEGRVGSDGATVWIKRGHLSGMV